jgi:antitoxin component of RelBE/YafQ-DinJ toxin-antitoxin module
MNSIISLEIDDDLLLTAKEYSYNLGIEVEDLIRLIMEVVVKTWTED